ncbi:MAG: NapC/NirT family cytochrome c [Candidatus Delongbacteria bacterium]
MKQLWLAFLRGLAINRLSRVGVVITTSAFVSFLMFEIAMLVGVVRNAYVGLFTYLGIPALFMAGLLLIPLSWWLESRRRGQSIRAILGENFDQSLTERRTLGALAVRTLVLLSVGNVAFISLVGVRAMHYMDQSAFCGTACHSVMGPEWAVYQGSPHARVQCVHCHIGEGVGALVDAKLNGAWQLISVAFNLYERPIPTPVHNLRPARYTCEKCHWPQLFHGDRINDIVRYQEDAASTPRYTTLMMKIGSGQAGSAQGSHWHVSASNEVRYASVEGRGEVIEWVDMKQPDGSFRRYRNRTLATEAETMQDPEEHARVMDCVDCHNRATHVFEEPAKAVDLRIHQGLISRALPFVKRQALAALTGTYADEAAAMAGIEAQLKGFYQQQHAELAAARGAEIEQAVQTVREIYRRNIHHQMKVTWGSYPNHLGHDAQSGGCFRCHNRDLVDEQGRSIPDECTLCHSILANDEAEPYLYLFRPDEYAPRETREMQRYLRDEFWDYTRDPLTRDSLGSPKPAAWEGAEATAGN